METKERIRRLAFQAALSPQEELLAVQTGEHSLRIGIPKEIALQERRVALDPDAVGLLVAHGHEVVVETGAGLHAQFTDADYSEAGARIGPDARSVYDNDIILKVAPPQEAELEHMRDRQTIFSGLQLATHPETTIEKMMDRKITAVAWDFMQDRTGIFPLVRAMGEIAGTTSILIAAEYLAHPNFGDGSMMGGMTGVAPSEVVIIGAGTVGEFATRAAIGLGASVRVFDASPYRLRRLRGEIGGRLWTSTYNPKVLRESLKEANVVIGAVRPQHGRTPMIVTEDMVRDMRDGSVIVDVSIDSGGLLRDLAFDQPPRSRFCRARRNPLRRDQHPQPCAAYGEALPCPISLDHCCKKWGSPAASTVVSNPTPCSGAGSICTAEMWSTRTSLKLLVGLTRTSTSFWLPWIDVGLGALQPPTRLRISCNLSKASTGVSRSMSSPSKSSLMS